MSSSTHVSRRTFARTAAWATPVVVTAVGAPAFAGSGPCTDRGTATLGCSSGSDASGDDSGHECTVTSLIFGSAAVTASVDIAATDADGNTIAMPDDTGVVRTTTYGSAWDYVNLHHPPGTQLGDTLTMTLTFSKPVRNFTLRITDIDKYGGSWDDEVFVAPGGLRGTGRVERHRQRDGR